MEMYDEAVELALLHKNVTLAIECADKPQEDDLKKKLWLTIAKYTIEQDGNVKTYVDLQYVMTFC